MDVIEVDEEFVKKVIKPRRSSSHKGQNGIVLVVGGSWLYHGAPFLSAMAALRTGVDLAYIATPEKTALSIRALSPNIIVIPLTDVKLTRGASRRIMKILPTVDAVVIGPGLAEGSEKGIEYVIQEALALDKKLVLDAAALYPRVLLRISKRKVVVTPHAGEFKRMFNLELSGDLSERITKVKEKAVEFKITILLKGMIDIISNGEKIAINKTGSPAMTVGGTGDVLTGIVAAILAKGVEPFEAAAVGAWFNGRAGEEAFKIYGLHITATDLIDLIPKVMKSFDVIVD
ncbi:MAG: NAD(P)H-hydrate dehydratase [Aigarchaeota archaeon]|nr:NAD(P)H-hydrate dehydratase [Aigarchaeota archaeon]MCX8192715.1 NAD(P)H-hydrate dehydratase [Nitrososphaeria archaeon]MDW7985967.1 NAD(P)H-hydrate dehydratase [Nitrososphaerota archaeon]